ncbi:MAG TPA: DUF488 domain-containing protein [Paralcaligenes sp.]|jgi:uncharacterized protein (DUF488 family)
MDGKTENQSNGPVVVCTIGHSNRPIDVFLDLLQTNEVTHVLDVRTIPRSLHNPQFGQDMLPAHLQAAGIGYTHMAGLGGLRHTSPNSPNGAWRNASFRGYADYMQTEDFAANIEIVIELARKERCVLMCAEAVPWRCHRSLIADALIVRGIQVEDIIGPRGRSVRKLTAWSHVDGLQITYPPEEPGAS